ncbi:MAG: class I SAM-dependent methyltransferase [Legionella sp.]|nr:class I SAM-dependent methyltransferase [Legionella sp.]
MTLARLETFPALASLYDRQIALTPRHATALQRRLAAASNDHLAMANEIAACVTTLAGENINQVVRDYDWICNAILQEELHFRRNGTYRLSSFADAVAEVYSNDELMAHYMNGLLMTQVWWSNHTAAIVFYVEKFLKGFTRPFSHLEIGPGHGMLLYLAGREPLCEAVHAWDVSAESIEKTRHAMMKLGLKREVELHVQDIYAAPVEKQTFDSIVLSEVLEHLEHPREALGMIKPLLKENGRLFINMPVNSPAPDHLFLLKSPEVVVDFVASCGYCIEQSQFEPQTNMTIEQARRTQSTITTLVIASR